MGLRTASVRQPHAEVMAPALTEANQTQTYTLPPDEQSASPIDAAAAAAAKQPHQQHGEAAYIAREAATCKSPPPPPASDARAALNGVARPMADRDAMGHRKMSPDDDDHLFDALPPADTDDLLQVFKALDDELLFGEDVMHNIGVVDEEPADARDARIRGLRDEVDARGARLERQLDFLLRRIRKYQMRHMGQHASAEMVGVFENVCRAMRRHAVDEPTADGGGEAGAGAPDPPADLKPLTPVSVRNLMKKLELTNAIYANAAHRAPATSRALPGQPVALPKWPLRDKLDAQDVAGYLESEMRLVQEEIDSEATASSSGADSCDEGESFGNPHQQHLAIAKRAAWAYGRSRATIGAKWTWLQSQIADLEYKIRQYTELYRKMRASKDPVKLGDGGASPPQPQQSPTSEAAPPNCLNGYRGQLPGASSGEWQCLRTRPLVNFRKRKLVLLNGLHYFSKRAGRPATMRCGCAPPATICALCTGRVDPTWPRDHAEYLSRDERLALLDPTHHPVFSLDDSVSAALHFEGVVKSHDWKLSGARANAKASSKAAGKAEQRADAAGMKEPPLGGVGRSRPSKSVEHRKKANRLIKSGAANALSAKINSNRVRSKNKGRPSNSANRSRKRPRKPSAQSIGSDGNPDEMDATGHLGGGKFDAAGDAPLLQHTISNINKRNRADSYDIDNIIIPFSVAATVRVEKLPYKEILTPKWRHVAEDDRHDAKNNGVVKTSQDADKVQEPGEDLSDAAVLARHEKSEQEERKKFLSYLKLPIGYGRSRANRRTDSRAESSGANTPDPMSPAPPVAAVDERDASRPATPKIDDLQQQQQPHHASTTRRRTISSTPDAPLHAVPPYEKRTFPLTDEACRRMASRSTSPAACAPGDAPTDDASSRPTTSSAALDHDSESTESAFGEDDPDPTDPEWEAEHADARFGR